MEARALGGLPRALARQYTQTIQPLLTNKCAAGSCHGPYSKRSFRMIRLRPNRSHRVFAEQNLAAVMRWIDRTQPERSPLLLRCTDGHDSRPRELFRGPAGRQQLSQLRKWVAAVAAATAESNSPTETSILQLVQRATPPSADPPSTRTKAPPSPDGPTQPAFGRLPNGVSPVSEWPGRKGTQPGAGKSSPRKAATETEHPGDDVLPRSAPDPFDPERFNQRRLNSKP